MVSFSTSVGVGWFSIPDTYTNYCSFLVQETLPSLLSTGWFQEWIWISLHSTVWFQEWIWISLRSTGWFQEWILISLRSTGWFQEWIWAWSHNQTKLITNVVIRLLTNNDGRMTDWHYQCCLISSNIAGWGYFSYSVTALFLLVHSLWYWTSRNSKNCNIQ